ncbi:YncE family protein [Algoriphagus halophilus]|uniref:DNA-binding beta-propeller fold protein YncE n=1 Tax=Algoriphagus halophilus TaxID=226505 RepID=A0A1N6EMD1_9BACT|nr:YncE family protein [Algoriphagus halophilus]SIN84081.1 DNA-binding beta-propeller fold protein YncE [Algoriphagus halophilus]
MNKSTCLFLVLIALLPFEVQPLFAQGNNAAVDPDSPVISFGPTPKEALLLGEKDAGRLVIIDPETLEVVARIPAGGNLHELATDGRYVYLGSNLPGITVVDAMEQKRVESIDISPFGNRHAITFAGKHLYIGHETNRLISRYDPGTKTIDEVIGLPGGSHMLIVTPDEQRIFTASSNGRLISIIDRVSNERGRKNFVFTNFPGDTRMEGMALSPDGTEFWVLHMHAKKLSIINVSQMKLIDTISFEGGLNNRIKFTKNGKYVLMNELQGKELRVWDVATRKEVKGIDVGAGGEGILIDPVRPRAYYAVSAGNKLVVIDTNTMTVIKEIPGFENPDGMDWFSAQ